LPAAMRADDFQLQVRARDGRGRVGETHEDVDVDADNDQVSIETDKSLYSPGEAITASITSSVPNQQVVFDVVRDAVILSSQMVRLSNGRATVTVPYRSEFKDRVAFVAYGDFAESRSMIGSRTVLFPHRHELTIDATAPPKQSYRPGDEAEFNFRVRTPEGRVAGALGLTVVDKAIDERSRTEGEFGRSYGFSRSFDFFETNDQIAGVSLRDLQNLDLSKPLPPGLDLAAEILLNQNSIYLPYFFGGDSFDDKASSFLADLARTKLSAARDALDAHYVKTRQYPLNDEELARLLSEAGIDLKELRDPWGVPYRAQFSTDKQSDILSFRSAGPDKRFDSDDDFLIEGGRWLYFRNTGEAIDRAVRSFHLRTGKFIRDLATLRTEARTEGLNLDALRDKWNEPYRIAFDIDKDDYVIRISSSGPDKKFPPAPTYDSDDFVVWTSPIDYFADSRAGISEALSKEMQSKQTFPRNEREFSAALRSSNQSFENLRDPWGHAYYAIFNVSSFYADRVQIERRGQFTQSPVQRTEVTPVTTRAAVIDVRSAGPDGKTGTVDDFTAATFSGALADQSGGSDRPAVVTSPVIFTGSDGAVTGLLRDPNGAAIAGATVTATRSNDSQKYSSTTNDEGKYLFSSLPPGLYEFRFTAVGFKATTITNVVVQSQNIVEVNVDMDVGATSETVMVTAAAPAMQTSQSDVANSITISGVINTRQVQSLEMSKRVNVVTKSGSSQDTSTPRLREYFPETLVWQPSLETDNQGRAQFKFKLADNITTWKMSVIGSTEDGEVGMVEKEITAFQPFFVDHDPPRILTAGDQISLPVVVRNYLNRAQNVNLDLKPESWFTLLGPAAQHLNVPAGDATRGTFDFRAVTPVKDGKQRITAIAGDANDAIEKPVTVHPDGEEKSVTGSDIAADRGAVNLDLPAAVIPNTTHAEVKIYPNLMAHVAESVEAIMERPYGCGEQTISSTYPSLLLLTHLKRTGQDSPVRARAERYLRAGYSRLLNYHDESGGFTYWGHGDPDVALTAYALRFLSDASQLMAIDDDLIKKTRGWLIKQQRPDGSWAAYDYWDKHENKRRTALLTAYVAHVLATTADKSQPAKPETQIAPELKQAFAYLAAPAAEIDEPYLIASYALARIETNDAAGAQKLIARLKTLAHEENGASYWSLETNTPFYGWGQAGQIETTALVVQALNKYCGMQNSDCSAQRESGSPANQQLINRGLLFLLRQQDRYGVWYSTQATINVLDAMLSLFARATTPTPSSARLAALSVNGREVKSIEMPEPQRLVTPITVDVSEYLHSGANQIELKRAPGSSPASMQAVVTYYLPWKDSAATPETNWRSNGSSGLRLVTHFDKTESQVQAEINCHVEAERIGLRGYGMMLAEIGLPPGADVDRASLETAMKGSDWGISQYDILPDRVVVYLWPQAGGTKFDFKFRPRFGLNAQSAASVVYDYYNPEARAIVAPTRFVVK
ncbi:MAG TPA: alpha-2-macroglobulin family protein, partial [Pyrinomonadaceae bacterium]|nr:alpha-2-macroglobulin family protein [Pyrinomonadaceae bacterium]